MFYSPKIKWAKSYHLYVYIYNHWPGSRAERPILSSAPRGGGGPPLYIGKQEVGTYIYSHTYTAHGALGRLH
jgi:hypothetical protein